MYSTQIFTAKFLPFFLMRGRVYVYQQRQKSWTSSVKGKEVYTKSRAAWGVAQARNHESVRAGAARNGRKFWAAMRLACVATGGKERLHESSSLCRLNQGKRVRCVDMSEGLGEQNNAIARKGCNGNFASRFCCTPPLHVPKLLH
jgi:hypothetical protein